MEASDVKRLKELEEENSKLKRMYANLSLVHEALKDAVEKSTNVLTSPPKNWSIQNWKIGRLFIT